MRARGVGFAGLVPVSAAFLLLLWFGSSVLRGKGVLLFAAGLAAFVLALVAFFRGRRQRLYAVFFVTLVFAGTVGSGELLLLLFPGVLRGRVANYVFGGYHGERDGIYRSDAHLGLALKPDFSRTLYWNGRFWHHAANSDGYRGPSLASADAVFLGDSMVYGHGVEADQTLSAQFETQTGMPSANLGLQGSSLVEAVILLREKGLSLSPRLVFACAHPNDADDALRLHENGELRRFVEEPGYLPLARPDLRAPRPPTLFDEWALHVALPLRIGRLLVALAHPPQDFALASATPVDAPGDRYVPAPAVVEAPFHSADPGAARQTRLGWLAQTRAIAEIKRLAQGIGARVYVFDLGYPRDFSRAVERAAQEAGVGYSPAGREALAAALAGEAIYLPNDGHWTPLGCRRVAAALARDARVTP
jgi:hypothetical protein